MDKKTQSKPLAMSEEDSLKALAKKNNLIFIGSLMELGNPPNDWSGCGNSYQRAKYKIVRLIKGQYGASEISVDHVVVYGSKTAQAGETPELSRSMFSPNNELIVFARKTDSGHWRDTSEDLGVLPATEEWQQKVEHALS
jgi:hypothetical protein